MMTFLNFILWLFVGVMIVASGLFVAVLIAAVIIAIKQAAGKAKK